MIQRTSSAEWKGGLKTGDGTVSTGSNVLSNTPYNFSQRFENAPGTNPEELIAAAHAACFSMALSGQLDAAGMTAEYIRTIAKLSMDKLEAGFTVTGIHLTVNAKIPGADAAKFQTATENAKKGCPISRVLNTEITMEAHLD